MYKSILFITVLAICLISCITVKFEPLPVVLSWGGLTPDANLVKVPRPDGGQKLEGTFEPPKDDMIYIVDAGIHANPWILNNCAPMSVVQ